MEISINGSPADITLEAEKTVGDILSGLDQWLSGTGSRLSGLVLDGEKISLDMVSEAFGRPLEAISRLDIIVSTWRELAAEALAQLREICAVYGNVSFDKREEIKGQWENSAAAAFLSSEIPDMHEFAGRSLSGEGLSPEDLGALAGERLSELTDPAGEIGRAEKMVCAVAVRLEELPLDIQTGKDGRAAETMQLFSRLGEKLFRLFFILRSSGISPESSGDLSVQEFMAEFNSALRELNAAYESRDAVLVGDLAEYEMAPRLVKFFSIVKDSGNLREPANRNTAG
jgi:hypothetical protein